MPDYDPAFLDFRAVLSPDGRYVAYDTADGAVVWDLDPEVLLDAACEVAGRDITEEEWDVYLGEIAPYRPLCEQ